jgi:hypothetical protein
VEIKTAQEIGKHNDGHKYVWHSCIDCGKERWVVLIKGQPDKLRCHHCALILNNKLPSVNEKRRISFSGNKNHRWRGGHSTDVAGYILIKINEGDPFSEMRGKRGYIPEHRLVMAQHLGRCLLKTEIVHHINRIRTDNKIENLEIMTSAEHGKTIIHKQGGLRMEIKLLHWKIKYLEEQVRNLTSIVMGIGEGKHDY